MNKEVWIGKKGFRYWYYKYRDSQLISVLAMIGTVVICFMLIFNIIIPQITAWFSIREEIVATRERIETIRSNISFMNNLDKNTLNAQLQTATTALPQEKEFSTMLDVLADSSISSGVELNDFSFQVGNIASGSGQVNEVQRKDLASIKITLVVVGTVENVKRFIHTIENSIPVSEVVNIDGTGQTVSLSIQFYQKTAPNLNLQPDQPLKPLSSEKMALIQKIAAWKKAQPMPNLNAATASGGALPLF